MTMVVRAIASNPPPPPVARHPVRLYCAIGQLGGDGSAIAP
ncbi:hypothetical protein [Phormidium tenue]|nr:hypothetical protein [Phormidium tenue]